MARRRRSRKKSLLNGIGLGSEGGSKGGSGLIPLVFIGTILLGAVGALFSVLGAPGAPDKRTQEAILLSQRK